MFRLLIIVLVILLGSLQFKLWLTQDGYPGIHQLEQQLATQVTENEQLQHRDDKLASEIKDLKQGLEAVEERARFMLEGDTIISNSSYRKTAISLRYRLGFSMRRSKSASSIGGVILRGRPPGFTGGLSVPNMRRSERIFLIEHSLHSAASAIWEVVKYFLRNISRISICFQGSRWRPMVCSYVCSHCRLLVERGSLGLGDRSGGMRMTVYFLVQYQTVIFW